MKVVDCQQGTEKWLLARCGLPTASEFDSLLTPLLKPRTGEGRQTYLLTKLAEKVMGYPAQTFSGGPMEQGSILEGEAVPWYEFTHNAKINRVGFCTTDDGRVGCSPDGLLGEDGGIEIKCPSPHVHLAYLLGGRVPPQYLAQVHGNLYVTGRPWWLFVSYNRNFPALVVKVARDEAWITALDAALKQFLADFDAAEAALRGLIEKGKP